MNEFRKLGKAIEDLSKDILEAFGGWDGMLIFIAIIALAAVAMIIVADIAN